MSKWTKELPTENGIYWRRIVRDNGAVTRGYICAVGVEEQDVEQIGTDAVELLSDNAHPGHYEWQGPIRPEE